jgi:hypothetical protein
MFGLKNKSISPAPQTAETPPPFRPLPAGTIENDGLMVSASPDLVALAVDGWILKQKIDALQKELKAITTQLENSLGAGAALVADGVCRVTIAERTLFALNDPDKARELLGGRFDDLVQAAVEYTLTDKLKEIVRDGDHALSAGLRECVGVKTSVSVTFRAAA